MRPRNALVCALIFCACVLGLTASPAAAASHDLFTSRYRAFYAPHRTGALAAGDLNGDGLADLVTNEGYRLGLGDGTLAPWAAFVDPQYGTRIIVVADVDGDGTGDIVQLEQDIDNLMRVRVRAKFANGWESGIVRNLPSTVAGMDVHDMNSDGNPDIAVAARSDSLRILIGDGQGGFPTVTSVLTGAWPSDIAIGDFDRDGIPDAAVLSAPSTLHGYVSIHRGLGNGVLGPRQDIALQNYASSYLITSDITGDGVLDLIAAGSTGANLLRGLGDGTFASPQLITGSGIMIHAGDFDGDTRTDVVQSASYSGASTFIVDWQDPFGALVPQSVVSNSLDALTVADFDRDGRTDVAAGGSSYVRVFSGNPSRQFGTLGYLLNNGATGKGLFGFADLDHDGWEEFVGYESFISDPYDDDLSLWVGRGSGNGSFTPWDSVELPNGNGVFSSALGDFNGDGRPDVAATRSHYCGFGCSPPVNGVIAISNAAGYFTASEFTRLRSSLALRIGDVNGDGINDIVTFRTSPLSGYPGASVILGAPGTPADSDIETELPGIAIVRFGLGDVNGDGRADLAVLDRILLANPNGTFGTSIPYPSGWAGYPVLVDLDADGVLDLMLTNDTTDLRVARGLGDGSFEPRFATAFPAYNGTGFAIDKERIDAADYDGDGVMDLRYISSIGSTFYLARGSFQYEATPILGAIGKPLDIDHDGRIDLVSGGSGGTTYFSNAPLHSTAAPAPGIHASLALAGPNPVRDVLRVRVPILRAGASLELWDITGRRVRQLAMPGPTGGSQVSSLQVAGLAPGAYVLVLRSSDELVTRRVTVLR